MTLSIGHEPWIWTECVLRLPISNYSPGRPSSPNWQYKQVACYTMLLLDVTKGLAAQ
jgi:hypothetical protein